MVRVLACISNAAPAARVPRIRRGPRCGCGRGRGCRRCAERYKPQRSGFSRTVAAGFALPARGATANPERNACKFSMHPDVRGSTNDALIRCIEECYSCAQTCTSCADACLAEEMVKELTQCVRLNLDCADVCNITGRIATRRTGSDDELIRRMLVTCAAACRLCGDECERHASRHEHCRICAETCRQCMQACQEVGRSMAH
jgi:hypothetical protein